MCCDNQVSVVTIMFGVYEWVSDWQLFNSPFILLAFQSSAWTV